MMKKKIILIIIIIILVIIGARMAFKVGLDFDKEAKIKEEVTQISKAFNNNNDISTLNEILDRRLIKKGQYKKVEETIKLYYKDLYNALNNLKFLLNEDNFNTYLSIKNLQEDSPKFLKSRDNLQNTKAQLEEQYTLFNNLLNDENVKVKYLNNKKIDKYYRSFYLELTTLAINENFKESINADYSKALADISVYNTIYDFLATQEEKWSIKNDVIAFEDQLLYEEYVKLTDKLKKEEPLVNQKKTANKS